MAGFVKLQREAVTGTDMLLNHGVLAVYVYVLTRAAFKPIRCTWGTLEIGECDSTQEQIAAATGMTRRRAQTCERTLQKMGLLCARNVHKRRVLKIVDISTCDDGGARDVHETVENGARSVHEMGVRSADNVHSIEVENREGEKVKKKTSSSAGAEGQSDLFETFWKAYPRKVGKGQAIEAYCNAIKDGISHERIMQAVSADVSGRLSPSEPQFIPHPSKWLNGQPWDDEPLGAAQPARDDGGMSQWDWKRCIAVATPHAYRRAEADYKDGKVTSENFSAYRQELVQRIAREIANEHGITPE